MMEKSENEIGARSEILNFLLGFVVNFDRLENYRNS